MTAPTDPIAEIRRIAQTARLNAEYRCADYLDAYADLLAQPRARTWQDIETAPKDGTWILGFGESWDAADKITWSRYTNCWILNDSAAYRVTHWMPLPAAPVSPATKDGDA